MNANVIGLSASGIGLGNLNGVVITSTETAFSAGNTIGGTVTGDSGDAIGGNNISGNTLDGVQIDGSSNMVAGNIIGTDYTVTLPGGNLGDGVDIGSSNNTIGGAARGRTSSSTMAPTVSTSKPALLASS